MMRLLMLIIALSMSAACVSVTVHAQTTDASAQLRIAQSLERSGDWERAIPIYESLLLTDPQNYVYYDALRRGYIQLKRYDQAIKLIQYRLTLQPESPLHLSALGGVYYQLGKETKADSIWQAIIRTDPSNIGLYRLVAGQMMEYRLYDRAIALFLQARKTTGDESHFTGELANLYGAFQQYENATREFVRLLMKQPSQLPDIQSRMSAILARPEAIKASVRVLGESVSRWADVVPLRQLYGWVLMEDHQYSAALEQYRIIDRLSRAGGVEIFNFAQRALEEKEYETSVKAFQEVLGSGLPSGLVPIARLGYAGAMEELSTAQDSTVQTKTPGTSWPVSEIRPSFLTAVRQYEAVIHDYPNSPFAARAYFRIGVMKSDRFNDLDGALEAFRQVSLIAPENPLARESFMERGRVLVAKNDIAGAREQYGLLLVLGDTMIRDRALFRLAELDYFTASFDTAVSVLRKLSSTPGTDLANDALQLRYFIEENSATQPAALRQFAFSDLLMRQKKYSEALESFRSIGKQFPGALLADDAVLREADLLLLLGRPAEAIVALGSLVADMPTSILRDVALMRLGRIYETSMKNTAAALEAYEKLLTLFPASLHAEEARRRIRILRGDTL